MVNTQVHLCGLTLDNPVIPASGTFGYGREFAELYDLDILGSISFKGTTPEERGGNPLPRIAECPQGMLNSVGLQNPGLEEVCTRELKELAKIYHKPVIANISGFSVEDYVTCARAMDREEQVGIIEVNISCPNVHNGGMAFGTDPASAAEVTKAVRRVTDKPVFMKLSPNVTDIAEIARACEAAGADGLSLINTLLGMRIDIQRRRPVLALLRPGHLPGGGPHGISGGAGGPNPDYRDGRYLHGRGCHRDDDGRCHGGTGGCCEPGGSVRLPQHHRDSPDPDGKAEYQKS